MNDGWAGAVCVTDHSLFEANLEALRATSPETARLVATVVPSGGVRVVSSTAGLPVLEQGSRALDSRRDPAGTAARQAATVTADRVTVAGLGSGYLAEAVMARGIHLAGIIEPSADVLAAAMRARDLQRLFQAAPVVVLESAPDTVQLAVIRADGAALVPHGPSVAGSPELAALVERWPSIPVADRAPRVLVAGPIYGGTLDTARCTSRAVAALGGETRLFDFSLFADGHHALGALGVPSAARNRLQAEYAAVLGEALVDVAREWKADLVLALAQAPLSEASLDRLRALGIPSAFWFVENGRVLTYWEHVARHYDWFYAIQPGRFLEQLAAAGARRPRYLPTACDPERHVPMTLTSGERARFEADLSFAGAPYLNRRRLLLSVADLGLRIWGEGWQIEPSLSANVAGDGARFTLDEMIRIFAATAVNLNLHSANHVAGFDPDPDYVNPRTFEIAACGAFQLVDWRSPLADLFTDEEMITFRSVPELRDQVAYYLSHADERQAIAARARARAVADHGFANRVERILHDALPPALAAAARRGVSAETLDQALVAREQRDAVMDENEALMRILCEVEKNWGLR